MSEQRDQELLALAGERRWASRLFAALGEAYPGRVWQRFQRQKPDVGDE